MEPWTRGFCLKLIRQAYQQRTVEKLQLDSESNPLTILSSPTTIQTVSPNEVDPFILSSSEKNHSMVCLQHDPFKVMARFRHFIRTSMDLSIEKLTPNQNFEFESPIIHNLMEIRANLEVANYLKEYPKEAPGMIENIYSNIMSHSFLSFPFVSSSLIYSVLKNEITSLVDMPDALLAMNVANAISLEDLKEIHAVVEEECLRREVEEPGQSFTSSEILCYEFPEIFQKPKDEFVIALLQKIAVDERLLVVLSAPTFLAVKARWSEKIFFEDVNKVQTKSGDSDEVMVEKHAILDSLLGSRIWADKFLFNRFPYIDSKENISKERKQKLQGIFHSSYLKYSKKIEEVRLRNESKQHP